MVSLFAIVSLLSAGVILNLGNYVLFQDRKAAVNRIFHLLCLSEAGWAFCEYQVRVAVTAHGALPWVKLGSIWPFTFALFFHFVLAFSGRKDDAAKPSFPWKSGFPGRSGLMRSGLLKRLLPLFPVYLSAAFIFSLQLSSKVLTGGLTRGKWGWSIGVPRNVFVYGATAWCAVIVFLTVYLCLRSILRTPDFGKRRQAELAAASFISFVFIGSLTELALPFVGIESPQMRSCALLIQSVLLGHGILKYGRSPLTARNAVETILSTITDVLLVLSPEGKILNANRSACESLGFVERELIGRDVRDAVVCPDTPHTRGTGVGKTAGPCEDCEALFRTKGGKTVHLSLSRYPLKTKNGSLLGFVLIGRDISERKMAEQVLRESEARLLQSQKMEAIGRLAGGVAHDFNNILTAISGFSEIILMKEPACSETTKYVTEIQKSIERAASLTGQLLVFSRKQVPVPKILDLNGIVARIQKMLRRIIGEDIELFTVLDPELGRVKADAVQIEQVLLNLAVNSRDAMPEGGQLIIETRNIDAGEAERLHAGEITHGGFVMLSVSDTGQGMGEDTKEKIFEPCFTTKEPGRGTGLGLWTVLDIVKQNGGHVAVDSEPSKGASLRVYLPRVSEEEGPGMSEREARSAAHGHETIIFVEDDEAVRTTLCRVLRDLGYHVLEAGNVYEALAVVEKNDGKQIHLLITDIVMPGMNGRELSAYFKTVCPATKVLYISGYSDYAGGLVTDGCTCFLPKPFTPLALSLKVREILDKY